MEYFIQQLVNGLTLGSIYGLIAIGYTMVYGIIGMINFAHGDIFMLGGFTALIVFLLLSSLVRIRAGRRRPAGHDDRRRCSCTSLWNWTIETRGLPAACAARSGWRR